MKVGGQTPPITSVAQAPEALLLAFASSGFTRRTSVGIGLAALLVAQAAKPIEVQRLYLSHKRGHWIRRHFGRTSVGIGV